MDTLNFTDFKKVDMRVGTVIKVEHFPEAKMPAYKLTIDFGHPIGVKKLRRSLPNDIPPKTYFINKW